MEKTYKLMKFCGVAGIAGDNPLERLFHATYYAKFYF